MREQKTEKKNKAVLSQGNTGGEVPEPCLHSGFHCNAVMRCNSFLVIFSNRGSGLIPSRLVSPHIPL